MKLPSLKESLNCAETDSSVSSAMSTDRMVLGFPERGKGIEGAIGFDQTYGMVFFIRELIGIIRKNRSEAV